MRRATLAMLLANAVFAQSLPFEVASVKPAVSGGVGGRLQFLPGGVFRTTNATLNLLILKMYGLRDFYQILAAPQSRAMLADEHYDIEAHAGPTADEAQMREMVKTLLAQRFQLKVHQETRDLPVYALVPAKGGIKLQPPKDRVGSHGGTFSAPGGWFEGNAVTMDVLLSVLTRATDRPVIDKTSFTEAFDFRLTWTPDTGVPNVSADGSCPDSFTALQQQRGMKVEHWSCPSIFTAVQDQLGLKLDPQKVPTDVLVIDHVERPSPN